MPERREDVPSFRFRFTPGPWRSNPPESDGRTGCQWYSCRVTADNGFHLADVRCGFKSADRQDECAANARLIAAAPALF